LRVPLLDLEPEYREVEAEVLEAVRDVVGSRRFILGPRVEELEERIAQYCGCSYAVAVSSGTDALLLSLMALGVGPGDFVVTTPFTFFATAGAIARTGARPLFVDIEAESYNMDPQALKRLVHDMDGERKTRIKAVVPVHLYGRCADMDAIAEVTESLDIGLVEDAAQAIGAEYRGSQGRTRRAGALGNLGCFSFYPTKNLGGAGEGGMVTTDDHELYERLRILRNHGDVSRYHHEYIGGNFRMDAFQGAVLLVKMKYLERWIRKRRAHAALYERLIADRGVARVRTPDHGPGRHVYHQFVVDAGEARDALRAYLSEGGVGTEIYYPIPLHLQPCFSYLGYGPKDFPVAERAAKSTLAVPMYPGLVHDQISYVVDLMAKFFEERHHEKK